MVAAFEDFDGITHAIGESWRFVSKNFVPYEDGLSLFVESEGRVVQIRLQWRAETQGDVINGFSDLVEEL